jgi:uncharacterized repeat protein (TIGR01451 family)
MTKTKLLLKGLLGASALTALSTGTAFAAGTTAGTVVSNTFTLDYNVGTTPQTQITGVAPTTFVVDRLIDVNVAPNAGTTVAPGSQDQLLNFTLTNEGNDSQAYVLTPANVASGDQFEASNLSIVYYVDDGDGVFEPNGDDGAPVTYNGTSTPDVAADGILFVQIEGDIPSPLNNGDTADLTLLAETAVTGGSGTLVTEDTDGNDINSAENVFADAAGDVTGDDAADGSHSATNTYTATAADLSAEKLVSVFAQTPNATNDCAVIPGTPATPVADQYAVPGSCVEYTITATNSGVATATAIDIADTLPSDLTFVAASASGFSTAGSFTTIPTNGQDCGATPCVVVYDGAELTDGSTTPTVGVVTIRALVK